MMTGKQVALHRYIRCTWIYYQGLDETRIDRKRINDKNKFKNYTREVDVRRLFGVHCRVWLDGKQNKTKSAHKTSRRHYVYFIYV